MVNHVATTRTERTRVRKPRSLKARIPRIRLKLILAAYTLITLLFFVLRMPQIFYLLKLDSVSTKIAEMFADKPTMIFFGKAIQLFFSPKGMLAVMSVIILFYIITQTGDRLKMFVFRAKSQISILLRPKPIFVREDRVFLRVFDLENVKENAMDLTNEERHVLPLDDARHTFSVLYEAKSNIVRLYRDGEYLRALSFDRKEAIDSNRTVYIKALLLRDN